MYASAPKAEVSKARLRVALDDQQNFNPSEWPKRAAREIGPNAGFLDRLASGGLDRFLLCMGLISLFCAAPVLRKAASDGLHQYWDECLNLEQSITVTEVAAVSARLPLPTGIDRTSQKRRQG